MLFSGCHPPQMAWGILSNSNSLMPTLPDYQGVSRIQNKSPSLDLPYGSPNLPDKSEFGYFFSTKDKKSSELILSPNLKKYCIFLSRMVALLWNFTRFWFTCIHIVGTFSLWERLGQSPKSNQWNNLGGGVGVCDPPNFRFPEINWHLW